MPQITSLQTFNPRMDVIMSICPDVLAHILMVHFKNVQIVHWSNVIDKLCNIQTIRQKEKHMIFIEQLLDFLCKASLLKYKPKKNGCTP